MCYVCYVTFVCVKLWAVKFVCGVCGGGLCVCEVMCVCQVVLSLCVCEVMCVCVLCVKFVCVKLLSVKFVYVKFVCSVCGGGFVCV